jgi:hypothetical protein
VRRDVIEEKEMLLKTSLGDKIRAAIGTFVPAFDTMYPPELVFCFTIMSDDGNVPSVLVAASCDLIRQAGLLKNQVWSNLMVLHETRYQSKE